MNNPTITTAPVIIVHLRQPRANDLRTDPLYEFGSFGLTGCHQKNLLSGRAVTGHRLAFAQGGPMGFRLVMLTPPVEVRELATRRAAFWSPADMPLRYDSAPLLIDNAGHSDVPGIAELIAFARRTSWMARFSSKFRSRKKPLPTDIGWDVITAWTRATQNPNSRASFYHEALPRRPDVIDSDRQAKYHNLLSAALGDSGPGPVRTRCC